MLTFGAMATKQLLADLSGKLQQLQMICLILQFTSTCALAQAVALWLQGMQDQG